VRPLLAVDEPSGEVACHDGIEHGLGAGMERERGEIRLQHLDEIRVTQH
jgi:hypothetical protein